MLASASRHPNPMRIFLIHGMARTPLSMWVLKRRFEKAGHRTTLFGYLVTVSDLDRIRERFVARAGGVLEGDAAESGEPHPPYAIVGHSLGNVVARLASPDLPEGFCRFAMLAPPNKPPVMAHTLRDNLLFKAATRDAGRKLIDEEFFASLPVPAVPSLIIAGTRGPRARWLPFAGKPNDSILQVEETRLDGVPSVEVPGVHSFLMNRRDVFETVRNFLDAEPAEGEEADTRAASVAETA